MTSTCSLIDLAQLAASPVSIFAIGVENFDLSVNKRGGQFGLPFFLFGILFF
jgi:hypothetical protein